MSKKSKSKVSKVPKLRRTKRAKDPALMALGDRIRSLRSEKGWSQEELADNCNLHRTYIGGIERGERNVSYRNLRRIADSLSTELGTLFKDIG